MHHESQWQIVFCQLLFEVIGVHNYSLTFLKLYFVMDSFLFRSSIKNCSPYDDMHIIEEDRNPLCREAKVTRTSLMNKLKILHNVGIGNINNGYL